MTTVVLADEVKGAQELILAEIADLLGGSISKGNLSGLGQILEACDRLMATLDKLPDFEKAFQYLVNILQEMVFDNGVFDTNLKKARLFAGRLDPLLRQYLDGGKAGGVVELLNEFAPAKAQAPVATVEALDCDLVFQELSDDLADESLASDFINETEDGLESAESQLMALEEDPSQFEVLIHPIFRTMHTLKGNSAAFGLTVMKSLAHHMEDLLVQVRDGTSSLSANCFELLFHGIDTLRLLLEQLRHMIEGSEVKAVDVGGIHQLLARRLTEESPEALDVSENEACKSDLPAENSPSKEETGSRASFSKIIEMIKVPALKLDELGELIGEMVVALSVLNQSPVIEAISDRQARERLDQLGKVTESLRERILGIRMFPVGNVFGKLSRQVRDLSRSCGKPLNFEVEGADTLVDKSIIDCIYAPLMHMVRNAIDHGIESKEERRAAGKPELGTVRLTATHRGDSILMEIRDDGKGIDPDAILQKGLERGLVRNGEELTNRKIFNLIFKPGFSTAKKVTDVSGRGVGLDVVKKGIESLRGRVYIDSKPGEGTTFSVKLPLTTSIIEGLVVRVGTSLFVVPILDVQVTITPKRDELKDVHGQKGEFFLYHGEVVPIIRLYEVFELETEVTEPTHALMIIVSEGSQKFGLMVDELLYRQQVVIKKLDRRSCGVDGISGGTILGNGRVGLILEPHALLHLDR